MTAFVRLARGQNNIDFNRWWKRGAVLSVLLVVVSVVALSTRGLNLGVEFTGGVSVQAPVSGVSVEQARSALEGVGLGAARVQIVTDTEGNEVLRVQVSSEDPGAEDAVRSVVANLEGAQAQEVSVTAVSASWGSDVTGQALRALVFFLLAILAYITLRLEFRMAIGAIIATVHDIVITVGVYALFQFEVSPGTIVAFLMVLGYSIYDTVVIYDKVKQNEPLAGVTNRLTYGDVVARSMNTVLLRSLNTSITSLLPVISLIVIGGYVLGATTLNQFALPLAVGLVVGTYSSIMVASYAVVLLKEREPRYRQLKERLAAGGAAGSPSPSGEGTGVATGGTLGTAGSARVPEGVIPPRPRKRSGKTRRS